MSSSDGLRGTGVIGTGGGNAAAHSPRHMYAHSRNASSTHYYGGMSGANDSSGHGTAAANAGEVAAIAGMRIKKGKLLGKGAFGAVYQAMDAMSGELLAIKQLPIAHDVTAHTLRGIEREIAINSSLPPHRHCVRYLGVQSTQRNIYIVMEHVSGGSIQSLLQSVGQFHERTMRSYSAMVLSGLQHLHRNNVVHQDIKGANVLIDEKGIAKIADFGCSKHLSSAGSGSNGASGAGGAASTTFHNAGTPLWMAPEVCRGDPATKSSDVWSFGCLLLEMVTAERSPWVFAPGTSAFAVLYAIGAASKPPQPPSHLSPVARDFVGRCLSLDPAKRPSVDELLLHPFLTARVSESSSRGGLNMSASSNSAACSAALPNGRSSQISGDGLTSLDSTHASARTGGAWVSEWDGDGGMGGDHRFSSHSNTTGLSSSPFLTRGPGGDTIGIRPGEARHLNLRQIYLGDRHTTAQESGQALPATRPSADVLGEPPGNRSAEFVLHAVDDDDDEDTEAQHISTSRFPQPSNEVFLTNQYRSGQQTASQQWHDVTKPQAGVAEDFGSDGYASDGSGARGWESPGGRHGMAAVRSGEISDDGESQEGLGGDPRRAADVSSSPLLSPHQHAYYYQSGGSGVVHASPASTDGFGSSDACLYATHDGFYTASEDDGTVVWQSGKSDVIDGSGTLFHTEEVGTDSLKAGRYNGAASETSKIASFFSKKFKCINPSADGTHKKRK